MARKRKDPPASNPGGDDDKPDDRPADQPADQPDDDEPVDSPVDSPGDPPTSSDDHRGDFSVPDADRIRINGTRVPMTVRKLAALVDSGEFRPTQLESPSGGKIMPSYIYRWRTKNGAPSPMDLLNIANFTGIALEYLSDDDREIESPAPRRWAVGSKRLTDVITTMGMTFDQVEPFLMAIKVFVFVGFSGDQALRIAMDAAGKRGDFLGGQARPGPSPQSPMPPVARVIGQTVAEQQAKADEERRRNGGPRPKHG